MKDFTIYKSSAGSGKTRMLAKTYLTLALQYKSHDYFQYILAVTFTNKAAEEMKDRILFYLDSLSKGQSIELGKELQQALGIDEHTLKRRSNVLLSAILHNYYQFQITTIDAFFQRIIHSFVIETGLSRDVQLELNEKDVLSRVIEELIDDLPTHKDLREWVVQFMHDRIETNKKWKIKSNLIEFSKELTKEEHLIRSDPDPPHINFYKLRQEWKTQVMEFINTWNQWADQGWEQMRKNEWTIDDFKWRNQGSIFKIFENWKHISTPSQITIGSRLRGDFQSGSNWPNQDSPHKEAIIQLADTHLIPLLNRMIQTYDDSELQVLSTEVLLENIYTFGLLYHIERKLSQYKKDHHQMFISDATAFIHKMIGENDTPFIYERMGSFLRHYLIDEFQDTSKLQWKNFSPLIKNSLASGYSSMVVGDVKQSIYRWRSSYSNLLQEEIEKEIKSADIVQLTENYRSARHIVEFNNQFFTRLPNYVKLPEVLPIYQEAQQKIVHEDNPGAVRLHIFKKAKPDAFKTQALKWLACELGKLIDRGVPQNEIAILVRKNIEGSAIADFLLQVPRAQGQQPFRLISIDSLFLKNSLAVSVIVYAMRLVENEDDDLAKLHLMQALAQLEKKEITHEVLDIHQASRLSDFYTLRDSLKQNSLYELTEILIRLFSLHTYPERTYLDAFQQVIYGFKDKHKNLSYFLEWWEEYGSQQSTLQLTNTVDAIQILTIHKAKGLQFPYVFIPFCNWPTGPSRPPILWVDYPNSKNSSFSVPVRYKKILDKTYWQTDYKKEHDQTIIDNVNLLYVAFTRAEQELFIATQEKNNTVGMWIQKSMTDQPSQETSETLQWMWGEPSNDRQNKPPTLPTENISYPVMAEYKPIQPTKWWKENNQSLTKGRQIHNLLSEVTYVDDFEKAIRKYQLMEWLSSDEVTEVTNYWKSWLQNPDIYSWFSPPWNVRTEVSILLPGGKSKRLDRLLWNEKEAIVIDFKTGKSQAEPSQVREYMHLLTEIGYRQVSGYFLYYNGEIESIDYHDKS